MLTDRRTLVEVEMLSHLKTSESKSNFKMQFKMQIYPI